jgi:hypothetical protein
VPLDARDPSLAERLRPRPSGFGPDRCRLDQILHEGSTMAENWYFAREGKRFGPFSAPQLKKLAATADLRPQDTVWKEGMKKGVLAAKVRHLFLKIPAQALAARPIPVPSAVPSLAPGGLISDDLELVPIEDGALAPVVKAAPTTTKRRVVAVSGGILVSQDGMVVNYRNKCHRCGRPEMYVTTMPIRTGITSMNFFCPKCRKTQQVEIRAVG